MVKEEKSGGGGMLYCRVICTNAQASPLALML
uniref:Uncharacterized protein n=1 Tax=Anguilla anguilla TaxID=7936 RepID=A0A0E9XTI8_ANGAN